MRKKKKGRKFGRGRDQRKALLRSLASNLFLKGEMKTTQAKAKELSRKAEKYITKAKDGSVAKKRLLLKDLSPGVVKKLVDEIAPKYKNRKGGYTRIIKLGPRQSDGAKMAIIELIK